jgi:hypothetical protein
LITELLNEKWLRAQKMAEDERVAADKPLKTASTHYIRFVSKRGSYNTITFSDVDLIPDIFKSNNSNTSQIYDDNDSNS